MKNINEKLNELLQNIDGSFQELNNKYCIRKRSIDMKAMYHFHLHRNINDTSYSETFTHFNIHDMNTSSSVAFYKQFKKVKIDDFQKPVSNLLNHIYSNTNKRRFLSVDGSQLNVYKKIKANDELELAKSKQYRHCLLSSIFDVDLRLPINYQVTVSGDERQSLISQLKYVRKKDVLIMDRGYHSKQLMDILINMNIDFIFRVKNNCKYAKTLNDSDDNDMIFDHTYKNKEDGQSKNKNIRLVKYSLLSSKELAKKQAKKNDTEDYYLLTSLSKRKFNVSKLANLYHKRWTVETNFNFLKNDASLGRITSKTYDSLLKNVSSLNFIFLLSGYIEYLMTGHFGLKKTKRFNYKNFKIVINLFLDKLLVNGYFNVNVVNKLLRDVKTLKRCLIDVVNGRHYKRNTKIPKNHWGNKSFYK
jgi:hypothetical protein